MRLLTVSGRFADMNARRETVVPQPRKPLKGGGAALLTALTCMVMLGSPASARAQAMYGSFREDHMFEPPVYLYQITKEMSANGVAELKDFYMFFTVRPQSNPFWNGYSNCEGVFMGGPFRTPAELAAALPPGMKAMNVGGSQHVARPVSAAPSKPPAAVQSPQAGGGVRGDGESASRTSSPSRFDLATIGSAMVPLLVVLFVLLAALGGLAGLFAKPAPAVQASSTGPVQTALTPVDLEKSPTLEDMMRQRQNKPPPLQPPEWEWVGPGTWRHRGGPPRVYEVLEPGAIVTPPADRFAPPPGYGPPAQTHPVWERPEPPPDFGTVVLGPGGVPLQQGPPTIFGQTIAGGGAGGSAPTSGGSGAGVSAPDEYLIVDTQPGTPWPEAGSAPLDTSEFDDVREPLRAGPPDLSQVPNPPNVTTEQMNSDASMAAHTFLTPDGGFDAAAAAAWIEVNYQIPPGPEGAVAPPYMSQQTYDSLKELQMRFLTAAEAIHTHDNNTSLPPIPPEAFGVDENRTQIVPVPAGTVGAMNARGNNPSGLLGTVE